MTAALRCQTPDVREQVIISELERSLVTFNSRYKKTPSVSEALSLMKSGHSVIREIRKVNQLPSLAGSQATFDGINNYIIKW
jgi:hypothetical protein